MDIYIRCAVVALVCVTSMLSKSWAHFPTGQGAAISSDRVVVGVVNAPVSGALTVTIPAR